MEARSACACQLFNRSSDTRIHSAFTQLHKYHGISVDDTMGATYAVQVRATRSIDMGSATWLIAWRSTCVQALDLSSKGRRVLSPSKQKLVMLSVSGNVQLVSKLPGPSTSSPRRLPSIAPGAVCHRYISSVYCPGLVVATSSCTAPTFVCSEYSDQAGEAFGGASKGL